MKANDKEYMMFLQCMADVSNPISKGAGFVGIDDIVGSRNVGKDIAA